jgi:hypothetical protein
VNQCRNVEEVFTVVCEAVPLYHFRRETTHYVRTSLIFALLLVSNLHLLAYSIPEIVAKAKPAIVDRSNVIFV